MYKVATLLFVAVLARGCDSKIVVDPVNKGETIPANGFIYALPNTVARVQVKVDKTTVNGAPYSPFAPIFAPDGDPVCRYKKVDQETYEKCIAGADSYSLQQGTTFSTYGEPDPTKVFLVRFEGKGAIDQSLSMTWNDTGLLTSASAQVTNRTGDIALSALKLVAGLGIKAALGGGAAEKKEEAPCGVENIEQDKWIVKELAKAGLIGKPLIVNYCNMKLTERRKFPAKPDTLALEIKEKIKDSDVNDTVVKKETFQELLAEAVKAYTTEVVGLKTTRTIIMQDQGQTSGSSSLLPAIDTEISKTLTELYLGTKKTATWEGTLNVHNLPQINCSLGDEGEPCKALNDPKKGSLVDVLNIVESGEDAGICLKAELDSSSKAIPPQFSPLKDCNNGTAVKLRFNFYPLSNAQLFTRIESVEGSEQSFRYRVPAQVKATLCDAKVGGLECDSDKKTYGSGVFSVAQLGKVISLPATRHSKTLSYELALVESTGALKTIKLNSAGGLDPATIDALSGIAGSIIDARQKGDEINQLTRQQQLLKLQDDICTIQKKYGLPCTVQPQ